MKRSRNHMIASVVVLLCGISTSCGEDETYTDNPTVDAIKVAEHARWAQTFDGGTVAYLVTSGGVDEKLCVARLTDGNSHTVINPDSVRCVQIREPR